MKKQRVMASAKKSGKKVVSPKRTTEDMLNAFEAKLAEAGVESKTDVGCSDHPDIPEGEEIKASKDDFYDPDAIFDQSDDCQEDFGIEGCGSVQGSDESWREEFNRTENVYHSDDVVEFEDRDGVFDEPGSIITLGDLKDYWNNNNMEDPILRGYPNFDAWFCDTKDNFLVEASCGVEGCGSVMSDTVVYGNDLQVFENTFYGTAIDKDSYDGSILEGPCMCVGYADDEEGHNWACFTPENWEKVKDMPLEEIYEKYGNREYNAEDEWDNVEGYEDIEGYRMR